MDLARQSILATGIIAAVAVLLILGGAAVLFAVLGSQQEPHGQFSIDSTKILVAEETVKFQVARNTGNSRVTGFIVTLIDESGKSRQFRVVLQLRAGEKKNAEINYSGSGLGRISRIVALPLIQTGSAQEIGYAQATAAVPESAYSEPVPELSQGEEHKATPEKPFKEEKKKPGFVSSEPKSLTITQYSIGEPTDYEQLYLEYINRARADPQGEAQRLKNTADPEVLAAYSQFGVNLDLMVQQFSTLLPVQPIAFNQKLLAAARIHTQDMFDHAFQNHYGSDGSDPGARLTRQGYNWQAIAENIYATARSVFYGHAGFEVDWGVGPGGMQSPPGHRNNIHNGFYREAGIGVINGSNTVSGSTVGPQVVTQDFATEFSSKPIITGVAFYDFDNDNFYDIGEGIGGVRVDVAGANYYAVTSASGGYAVPAPGNGTYNVSFSGTNFSPQSRQAIVSNGNNAKIDFIPIYQEPVITGLDNPVVGQSNNYTFMPVGGATDYEWSGSKLIPYTYIEGAENGTANVTITSTGTYQTIVSTPKASGNYSFHLAHPSTSGGPADQFILINKSIRPTSTSTLSFSERLGWASIGQIARAQVSVDSGANWQDAWSRAGTGTSGQASFVAVSVPLAGYAGKDLLIRFMYDYVGGTYYGQTSTGLGLYADDITVSNAEEVTNSVAASTSGQTSFAFIPGEEAKYSLKVRPRNGQRAYLWSGPKNVNSTAMVPDTTPPSASITSPLNGQTLSGDILLAANAVDTQSPVAKVYFYRVVPNKGDVLVQATIYSGPPFTAVFSPSIAGTYSFRAKAIDAKNNEAYSETVSVNVTGTYYRLDTYTDGTGYLMGTITGPGISCGTDCIQPYLAGTSVTLTANPRTGAVFAGWRNCPNPSGNTCAFTADSAKTIVAVFNRAATATTGNIKAYRYDSALSTASLRQGTGILVEGLRFNFDNPAEFLNLEQGNYAVSVGDVTEAERAYYAVCAYPIGGAECTINSQSTFTEATKSTQYTLAGTSVTVQPGNVAKIVFKYS